MTGERQDQKTLKAAESGGCHVRLEQELRANLLKRKAQAKARLKDGRGKDRNEGRQS
jgi:hypothetical protein